MSKLFIKGIIGVLLLGVLGNFVFQIYQQSDVIVRIKQWFMSGQYFFEEINQQRMHQQIKIQQLNNSMPAFDKIYNAMSAGSNHGLEKADIDKCRQYYRLILEDMPQMTEAHVFWGICEDMAGNIPGAYAEFKQGLDSATGVFWAGYDLGILAMVSGNKDVAESLFSLVAKLPLEVVMKNIFSSRLFQQYMQVNHITPQHILDGLTEVHNDAVSNIRLIEDSRTSATEMPLKHEMRLRVF